MTHNLKDRVVEVVRANPGIAESRVIRELDAELFDAELPARSPTGKAIASLWLNNVVEVQGYALYLGKTS